MKSKTLSVEIKKQANEVYRFISNPKNLPQWAKGLCRSVRKTKTQWILETASGPMKFRFAPKNKLGVLDHYVTPLFGRLIYVPMRVVPRGSASVVTLTIFWHKEMSEQEFERDMKLVQRDMGNLKTLMENQTNVRRKNK